MLTDARPCPDTFFRYYLDTAYRKMLFAHAFYDYCLIPSYLLTTLAISLSRRDIISAINVVITLR